MTKRLLILGPSFRRRKSSEALPAIERYDGLFLRVARKYLSDLKGVDILVMNDDLILVDAKTTLPYAEPQGESWRKRSVSEESVQKAAEQNAVFLGKKLKSGRYSEVFVAMGKEYAKGLPDLSDYNLKVVFPTYGGLGPKALALKEWLAKSLARS